MKRAEQKPKRADKTPQCHIHINPDHHYPLVPLLRIGLVERPPEGQEADQLFFNPRSMDSFTPEAMAKLKGDIARDGLRNPPIVRVFTSDGSETGEIDRIELVAGERRLRSCLSLYEENAPVRDHRGKVRPAQEVLASIPCSLLYNATDEEALRHAFLENDDHQPLSTTEEIVLVERLARRGMLQDEIAEVLGTNVTWVSQTGNFRNELPNEAFEKLLDGTLSRHVAVQMLSFKPGDRQRLFEETVKLEEREREEQIEDLTLEVEKAEDEELIHGEREKKEAQAGNKAGAERSNKRKQAATKRLAGSQARLARVRKESGTIRQGHLQRAAVEAGLAPKKAKTLTRQMIEQFYRNLPEQWLTSGKTDRITKQPYPPEIIEIVMATADAILKGQADPGAVIRHIMVIRGEWTLPEDYVEEPLDLLDIPPGDEEISDDEIQDSEEDAA